MVSKKKPVIMLVDDEPIPEVAMARALEQHERTSEFDRLCNLGHVRVVQDNCASHITVQIEDEHFTDIREEFPSVQLMARLQLAIAAGRSCRNTPSDWFEHQADAFRHLYARRTSPDAVWLDEGDLYVSDAVAQGYSNVAKKTKRQRVTAAVKGLRP